jgi:hypothetical protein
LSAQPPSRSYGNPTLRLAATADGRGHTKIIVEMGVPWLDPESSEFDTHVGFPVADNRGDWVARISLKIEAGQLDEIAARAAQLPFDCLGHW